MSPPIEIFGKLGSYSQVASDYIGDGRLANYLEKNGRFPPVSLIVKPLSGAPTIKIDRFLSYTFQSSIINPVDAFSFNFAAPDAAPLTDLIQDGDIVNLVANDTPIGMGFIDVTETEVDGFYGERSTIQGRDVMGQLEDQDAISLTSQPIQAQTTTVSAAIQLICQDTKITTFTSRNYDDESTLVASFAGESKLSTLQRLIEDKNILVWAGPEGELNFGKPNMSQSKSGEIIVNRAKRVSNVLSARVRRSSTQIGNKIAAIWTAQEGIVNRVNAEQILENGAEGPSRLAKAGYIVPRAVVTSIVTGLDPQGISSANKYLAAGANILQAMAKRQIARENFNEMIFECVVAGHYNEKGEPYRTDTVYAINFDRGKVFENMYLYAVQYQLSPEQGQTTTLQFCRLGTIVADVRAPG